MPTPDDPSVLECLETIKSEISAIKCDIADIKSEIILWRVIIENSVKLMGSANDEPQTERIT